LVALFGVSGARVSPGCVSLGTEIFISLKNVAENITGWPRRNSNVAIYQT
jgi:hypothetical protein